MVAGVVVVSTDTVYIVWTSLPLVSTLNTCHNLSVLELLCWSGLTISYNWPTSRTVVSLTQVRRHHLLLEVQTRWRMVAVSPAMWLWGNSL